MQNCIYIFVLKPDCSVLHTAHTLRPLLDEDQMVQVKKLNRQKCVFKNEMYIIQIVIYGNKKYTNALVLN